MRKVLHFLCKDSRRYHKSFAKAGKGVSTIANASVYSNTSYSILEPSRLVRNLPPHKQITKNLTILQINRLSNISSA